MKNFVLIGAGGYVAPRHLEAIKVTGNRLLAALDKNDSVGILDSYFPDSHFFTEFERFDRHCEKLRRQGTSIDYVSVCSPNYLHDAHCRFGLRMGADVICEKPVVLNPWNVDALAEIEKETEHHIFNLLQLRFHPQILALREKVMQESNKRYKVDLTYITPRGNWYQASWKGDVYKSGGIATNIGVHFFDILIWIFGDVKKNVVDQHDSHTARGHLAMNRADVNWLLSIDRANLPAGSEKSGSHRMLKVNGEEVEFSETASNLHIAAYKDILQGNGVGLQEAKKVIELLHAIRNEFK